MIVCFDQEAPIEIVGGKGHHISRMWQAGLPVPPGFCVTPDEIDLSDSYELYRAIAALDSSALAVRSSAIYEDAADASFAGMLMSRLNIPPEDVPPALQEIRKSASTPAAMAYCRRLNVPCLPRMAAVVQTFVTAEASGVLFMRDPQTAGEHFVVEASWGLGPGVVEGLVRPDRWTISTDGNVISAHIADKDIAIAPHQHGGTRQISVDPACRRRPCINTGILHQLSRLATRCERLFAGPQDIEWAVCDNRIWLLQSRPITCSH